MDARPQRIRVRGDENALVGVLPNMTIHQRNKSTPALSTIMQNGGLRNTAKRTAFGDVSNTRASKDDIHLAGKNIPLSKPGITAQDKMSLALSQPAQRPMSVTGVKAIPHNNNSRNSDNVSKQVFTDITSSYHSANNRKLLPKRSNAVFKDHLPPVVEARPSTVKPSAPRTSDPVKKDYNSRSATTAALHDTYGAQAKDALLLPKEFSKDLQNTSDVEAKPTTLDIHSDGSYIVVPNVSEKESPNKSEVKEDDKLPLQPSKQSLSEIEAVLEIEGTQKPETSIPRGSLDLLHARSDHGAGPSEPEEYWDDDEDYNDEDDGYITTRSYRSRSENTTGGATTVLFPKYNQKARKEIAIAKQLVETSRTAEDIEDETWDTSMVAEYGDEIFEYMREMEIKMLPNAHYMENQAEIQWSMRSVLMDWLVQVHHRFSLLPETLFLSVNYIDRFLSCKIVSLGKLQLVGATAIFIAAKYEEINCPSIQEIVYMVDGGYTVDEILKAEKFMLSMLQFELGWPGPMSFLRRISKADDYDLDTRTLAKYFLEVTIMDERFVGSPPSFTAAGAHCLARLMLCKGNWSHAHVYYSNYTYKQLHPLLSIILECCENPLKHHGAIYDKYSDRRFKRSSLFVEAELTKGFRIPDIPKDNYRFV
ncbi:putative G2/mitotic-specific cyclin [Talaromyces proteolyticus]|uniref:G2/mitotic-specific cyclin n=1 Tax=Talaromyces proteolyticus TaxID=1131652 RepID=A0AAD4KNF5_9EURO|nr:putative G2/mitotic-specific cyclin [Talaromyces proteolyticus]KAH8696672.1 putative G2/mitotic-specific cyclin [Talaromyces proteolyticus]